jgi:hypothetical protein
MEKEYYNTLLNYIICNIFDIPNFYDDEYIIKSMPSKNIFGVFVSIKRSSYQALNDFPYNIHGCIGKYDLSFKIMSNNDIFYNLLNVSKSAIIEDNRRTYFKKDLIHDAEASIEISLMKNTIYDINPNTGYIFKKKETFNNSKYGIIAMNALKNKTATFLPNVFDNISWDNIKNYILEKSNISIEEEPTFVAYTIDKYEKKLIDLLEPNYINSIFFKIGDFFNKNYNNEIPYAILRDGDKFFIHINDEDDIRNIATLKDLTDMNNIRPILNKKIINNINNDITKYNKKFEENKLIKNALSFLKIINNDKKISKNICKELLNNLNNMERNFELGQALIALVNCGNKEEIKNNLKDMYNELFNKTSFNIDDIYRINWQTKALLSHTNKDLKHLNLLSNALITVLTKYNHPLHTLETNQLAVCFECLSSIKKVDKNNNDLNNILFIIFILLQQRFSKFGLYMFSDNTARVDITGHCIQGFLQYY